MTLVRRGATIGVMDPFEDAFVGAPSDAQGRVLEAIGRLLEENGGWPVTVRAICDEASLASTSTVHAHFHGLIRAGYVERSPYEKGGFRLSRRGWLWVERRRERMAA